MIRVARKVRQTPFDGFLEPKFHILTPRWLPTIGIVGQPTIARLMAGLRPARTGVLAFLFLVRRRRLGRSTRRFVRSLKLDQQLNQLVLAQALQISPIHAHMDSEIALRGKGVGKYGSPMSSGFAAISVSARPMEKRVPLPHGYRRATLTRPQNETEGMH